MTEIFATLCNTILNPMETLGADVDDIDRNDPTNFIEAKIVVKVVHSIRRCRSRNCNSKLNASKPAIFGRVLQLIV
ncbi:MAG: hypothetical protein DWI22_20175 [Planctomycetota bacterium]|nr:MAG: hypothetical protein DWI22_20175 [Planctomycetota bacterium]